MWTCLSSKWGITVDQRDCSSKIAMGGSAQLVYPAVAMDDLKISYNKDPAEITITTE
jgi:hypothetical protein